MIERLQRALEHIEELPEEAQEAQEALAEQIERLSQEAVTSSRARTWAGAWSDLPDDMEETLLRWRHEAPVAGDLTPSRAGEGEHGA